MPLIQVLEMYNKMVSKTQNNMSSPHFVDDGDFFHLLLVYVILFRSIYKKKTLLEFIVLNAHDPFSVC